MKKKGFTLVELLVVISIIALLMSVLLPTLAKVRAMAQRAVCSTNLASLHKHCLTYAQDNQDDYPRAGGKTSQWSVTSNLPVFHADTEQLAFRGTNPNATGRATMGASLYLLIKYADAAPKEYMCGGDRGVVEFELSLYNDVIPDRSQLGRKQDIALAWDFGGPAGGRRSGGIPPAQHYSYSFQTPYGGAAQQYYSLSSTVRPDKPIMADRNPYLVLIREKIPAYVYNDPMREQWGNSPSHKYEGQNVLYNNSSVSWEPVPYCGTNQDNIYTIATDPENPQMGTRPALFSGNSLSQSDSDSLLLNEGFEQEIVE